MQQSRYDIQIYRGETFTLDKLIVNKDGSPYIISSEYKNPHFLLSITDSHFDRLERIVINYWLDIERTRFYLSQPIEKSRISNFDSLKFENENSTTNLALDGELYEVSYNFAVVYDEGTGRYLCWSLDEQKWVDYECRFACAFRSEDTRSWPVGSYTYTIQLVTGSSNREYLEALASSYGIEYVSDTPAIDDFFTPERTTNEELYNKIKDKGYKFPDDYDYNDNQALGTIDNSYSILGPNTIDVTNYSQGDVVW